MFTLFETCFRTMETMKKICPAVLKTTDLRDLCQLPAGSRDFFSQPLQISPELLPFRPFLKHSDLQNLPQ